MKYSSLLVSSFLVLLASPGCALLGGGSSSSGSGDGDGTGGGNGTGGGITGDGDGDPAIALDACSTQCETAAACGGVEDPTTCVSECSTSVADAAASGCLAEYEALLGCLDPCDETSAAACESLFLSYGDCMTGATATGGASSGTGGAAGTGGSVVGSGGSVVGTGGSVMGTGSAPGTGGSASTCYPQTGPASDFVVDGWGSTAGGWQGYLFTVQDELGGTISPPEGSCWTGTSVCASGYTGASYEGFGIIGFNIAQTRDPVTLDGGPESEIVPGGSGVAVTVLNNAGSGLRVQIQNNSGTFWCAQVPATGTGVIPWTSFNTQCWEPALGTYYAYEPISQVMVQAPASGEISQTSFDFCVISLDQAP